MTSDLIVKFIKLRLNISSVDLTTEGLKMRPALVLTFLLCLCSDCFSQECRPELLVNIDFPGADTAEVYSPDAHHCQQMCTEHPKCQFFTFGRADLADSSINFKCYMKQGDSAAPNTKIPKLGITSGYSLKNCPVTSASCFSQIYRDVDFPGADYRTFFTANYKDCQTACTNDPNCQFFTWANSLFSDVKIRYKCHLKFSFTVPVPPEVLIESGYVAGFAEKAQISTNWKFMEECQSQYFFNTDIPGDNLLEKPAGSAEHCQILCAAHPLCTFFSFTSTTCFLKNNPNQMVTVPKQGVTSGLPSRLCQQNKDWLSVAHTGLRFPHSDFTFAEMNDAEGCRSICNDDANCLFYTYVTDRAADPEYRRLCHIKRSVTIPAPPKVTKLVNVVSGFHLRSCGQA